MLELPHELPHYALQVEEIGMTACIDESKRKNIVFNHVNEQPVWLDMALTKAGQFSG